VEASHLVDVHTHYLPRTLVEALEARAELPRIAARAGARMIEYGEGNGHPLLPEMGEVSLRLRDMDAQGIAVAVVSVNVPGVDWFPAPDGVAVARDVNDELVELVAAHPERLAALATLPMQDPEAAVAELERAAPRGLCGALVYSKVAGRALDKPELWQVYDAAAALDLPLYIHPTYPLSARTLDAYALISSAGFLFDTTTAALRLVFGGLFERHPDFKLVLSHTGSLLPYLAARTDYESERFGFGPGSLAIAPSEHLRLIYTDCVSVSPAAIRMASEFFGPERMMFGSDYPFWDPARSVEALAACDLDTEPAAALAHQNAERLFGLRALTQGGSSRA
jgi:aminocarboxymuconate-semialdehyde decarboxylase